MNLLSFKYTKSTVFAVRLTICPIALLSLPFICSPTIVLAFNANPETKINLSKTGVLVSLDSYIARIFTTSGTLTQTPDTPSNVFACWNPEINNADSVATTTANVHETNPSNGEIQTEGSSVIVQPIVRRSTGGGGDSGSTVVTASAETNIRG